MLDPERRSLLLTTKLRALARGVGGVELDETATVPGGAVSIAAGTAYALIDTDPARRVGAVLAWALARDATRVVLLSDAAPDLSVAARRASQFAVSFELLAVQGSSTTPVTPAPPHQVPPVPPGLDTLVEVLVAGGAEVVVEHGQLRGELHGLEVARVESGPDGVERLVVGVGRHDRDAFPQIHGELPVADALAIVVEAVAEHRRVDSTHPYARLVPERWLRRRVAAEPTLAGLDPGVSLRAVEPTLPRESIDDRDAALLVGEDAEGPVLVACSVGIDLEAVPAAADARLAHAPDARLVVVVPERDAHPVQHRLAAALRRPAEVRTVPGEWR